MGRLAASPLFVLVVLRSFDAGVHARSVDDAARALGGTGVRPAIPESGFRPARPTASEVLEEGESAEDIDDAEPGVEEDEAIGSEAVPSAEPGVPGHVPGHVSRKALKDFGDFLEEARPKKAEMSVVMAESQECNLNGTEGCSLEDLPIGESARIYPGGATGCLDSSKPYFFQVIRGDADKLVYFFEGGGACWDSFTLSQPYICKQQPTEMLKQGVLADEARNPYQNYTKVVLMYCSGDAHAGSAAQPWGVNGTTVHLRGFHNARAVFDWTKKQFPALRSLVLAGSSAGALAVQWWADEILDAFSDRRPNATVIADSFIGALYPTWGVQPAETHIYRLWKICETGLLNKEMRTRCDEGKLLMEDVWLGAMQKYPNATFVNINSKQDIVQIYFTRTFEWTAEANVVGFHMTPGEYYKQVILLLQKWSAQSNYRSYLVNGQNHCFLNSNLLYTTTPISAQGGLSKAHAPLVEWIETFQHKDVPMNNVCVGPLEMVEPDITAVNNTDYCDASIDEMEANLRSSAIAQADVHV